MTMDEYKSWAYVIFITQTHNPYSSEFSMEKMFPLPNQPKEQVNFKNTLKLAEESISVDGYSDCNSSENGFPRRFSVKTALHPDEKVIYLARQHWVVYFVGLIASMAVGFAGYALSGLLVGIPLGILTLFYFYLLRKNNIWVVTNKRFIDEWGVFVVNTKETPLDKINNVGYQKTPIGMILGFGNVSIQSAAEAGVTYAKYVPQS